MIRLGTIKSSDGRTTAIYPGGYNKPVCTDKTTDVIVEEEEEQL